MTDKYTNFDAPESGAAVPTNAIQGRLEVTVINNSGADLAQYSAYSLEDNAYTEPDNTVRLTAERTGIPTQGQTGLFFCQDAIPDGTTGIGIIVGMVTTTVLQSNDTERQLKVLASGGLSDIVSAGEYVVGVVTRSPLEDTPLEIAFDGLSHYKFVVGGAGSVFDIVDWTTLVLAPTSGDQTGSITGGVYKWVRQCTYRTGTYFRVVSVAEPLTKDGWYIDTTTSVIGTIVPNGQRI